MKKTHYYILLILLLSLACCKRDNTPSPSIFSKTSYPLALGDWWQYQLNSSGSYPDTFTLRVDSVVADGPYKKFICNYVGNGAIISAGYFLQSDTSLSFVQPYGYFTSFPSFHMKFPVTTGQYWAGTFPGDSVLVVGSANSYSINGNTYKPCYYTNESYNLPHNFKRATMTLVPQVGLTSQSMDYNSDTAGIQIQQSITLINFNVQ